MTHAPNSKNIEWKPYSPWVCFVQECLSVRDTYATELHHKCPNFGEPLCADDTKKRSAIDDREACSPVPTDSKKAPREFWLWSSQCLKVLPPQGWCELFNAHRECEILLFFVPKVCSIALRTSTSAHFNRLRKEEAKRYSDVVLLLDLLYKCIFALHIHSKPERAISQIFALLLIQPYHTRLSFNANAPWRRHRIRLILLHPLRRCPPRVCSECSFHTR